MPTPSEQLSAALSDRYRIERELGAGGMATVYLAQDLRHDRKVALKVLRPELAAVIGAERFLAEIKTTANLQHPHILPLFDSGIASSSTAESPNRPGAEYVFYVMPYVEGESLRDQLTREQQLPVEDAVRIAREVADALDYAHGHGVIHRDIKPENILLHGGHALVADFGIALAASRSEGGSRMTETGMSLGTPHYMSPEQAMGQREITARSDVYALGCVLYEMLSGEPPFNGPTPQAIVARVMTEDPRSLTLQRRSIPPHVEAAVMTALEKLPADRFASAAAFGAALQGQGGVRTAATVASVARVRRVPPTVLTVLTVLTVGTVGTIAISRSREAGPTPVRHWNIVLPDSAPVDYFAPSLYGDGQPALAISRKGDRIAYVARRGGSTILYFRRLDEAVSHPLTGTDGASQPFFSPDGEWIGFFARGELKKVAVGGGSPIVIVRTDAPRGAAWTTDGRIIFAARDAGAIHSVPASGGNISELGEPRGRLFWPSLLPREEWVVGSSEGRRLVLWSLKDGRGLALGASGAVPLESSDTASLLTGGYPRYVGSGHLVYLVGNTLMALPFDPVRLRVLGPPAPVIQELRREAWDAAGQYDVAADGTLLFAGGADASKSVPVWVDHSGRITDSLAVPPGDYFNFYVSGNGRRVALSAYQPTGEQTLSILDVDRGLIQELRLGPYATFTAWWPDGEQAILHLGTSGSLAQGIPWRVPINGTGTRDSLLGPGWQILDVSPDLKHFGVRRWGDSIGAWLVSADGKQRQFIQPGGAWPVFSPDARWVAVVSPEGLKVSAVPPTGSLQTVAPASADEPEWSPKGDELYYRDGSRWMVMSVSTRNGLTVGKPRLLLEGRYLNVRAKSYDVGPDGRFLMLLGPPEETVGHLDVVTGFSAELRRLAPPAGK